MIESLVEQIESRFAELAEQMADPEIHGDRNRYAEVARAYRQLEPAARLAQEWRRAQDDAAGAEELLAEGGDDAEVRELQATARERIAGSRRSSAWRWSSAIPTTTRTSSSRSVRERGERRHRCSPAICTGCSSSTRSVAASRSSR
jgi:hypothetical protein